MFISRTLKRYADTKSIADRHRPGRPRSVRTVAMRKNVVRQIRAKSGQEYAKNVKENEYKQGINEETNTE